MTANLLIGFASMSSQKLDQRALNPEPNQLLAENPLVFEAANQLSLERGKTAKLGTIMIARLGQRVQQPLRAFS